MRIEEKEGNFVITDFNELEAYKIASKIEKDGIDFYKRLSEKVEDKSKEALNFLLTEEKKHLRIFEEFLFRIREKQEDLSEDEDLLSSMDYGIFQPYQSMEELDRILNEPKKALKLGIIIEDKSIKFYELCKDRVSKGETKKEISNIIQEEYKHKGLLEDMLSNL